MRLPLIAWLLAAPAPVPGCGARAQEPAAAGLPAVPAPATAASPSPGASSDDMIAIPGGLTLLGPPRWTGEGPRPVPPGPGGTMGLPGATPGTPAGDLVGREIVRAPALWTFAGGMGLEHIDVWVEPFRIDRTEVTRAAYREFLVATGYRPPHVREAWADDGWNWTGLDFPPGTGDHPVVLINWYDAQEYCAWRGKRLPTEAEWQLAALGPAADGRDFPWGDTYDGSRFNHGKATDGVFDDSDGYRGTSPVGAFPAGRSPYGLEDAFGNAFEYAADLRLDSWDLYERRLQDGAYHDVRAPGPGLYAAVRGGAFFFDIEPFPGAERNEFLVEVRRKSAGFRCAR